MLQALVGYRGLHKYVKWNVGFLLRGSVKGLLVTRLTIKA